VLRLTGLGGFAILNSIYSGTMTPSMPTDLLNEKQQVHELIDRLAPSQVTAVRGLLEAMLDPISAALAAAPPDDEPITDEDRRRIREGEAWFKERGGHGIPMDEILAESGVRPEDLAPLK
jgi:hypothetical protein